MIANSFLKNINKNENKMMKLNNQLSSGKNFFKVSENPSKANSVIRLNMDIENVNKYLNNVSAAQDILTQTETNLMDINASLSRINELVIQGSSSTNDANDKKAIAKEIEQLRDHIIQAVNSKYSGKNLFGGFNTATNPINIRASMVEYNEVQLVSLSEEDLTRFNSEKLSYEVDKGFRMEASYTGIDILGYGNDNLYDVLTDCINKMNANENPDTYSNSIKKLQEHQDNIISKVSEIGIKMNRLSFIGNKLENERLNKVSSKSKLEDVDYAKAIVELRSHEAIYEAALSSGSKLFQYSLANYLR